MLLLEIKSKKSNNGNTVNFSIKGVGGVLKACLNNTPGGAKQTDDGFIIEKNLTQAQIIEIHNMLRQSINGVLVDYFTENKQETSIYDVQIAPGLIK